MRTPLIILGLFGGLASASSQGTIQFTDLQSDVTIHIYAPQAFIPSVETVGNANSSIGVTADQYEFNGVDANVFNTALGTITAGGSTVYTGGAIGNTNPANPTPAGPYHYDNGSDWTVQLFAAPGFNAASSALQPVSQYVTTIYTSSTLGGEFKAVFPRNDPGMPFTAANATIMLVVWYNGGVLPTGLGQSQLNAQLAADQSGNGPWAESPTDNLVANGDLGSPPNFPPDLQGLQSFAIVGPDYIPIIPEPDALCLIVSAMAARILSLSIREIFTRQNRAGC